MVSSVDLWLFRVILIIHHVYFNKKNASIIFQTYLSLNSHRPKQFHRANVLESVLKQQILIASSKKKAKKKEKNDEKNKNILSNSNLVVENLKKSFCLKN